LRRLDCEEKELRFRLRSWQVNVGGRAPSTTILFIPFSAPPHKLETEWEKDCDKILRRCPVCQKESIIGHGRRRKHAHDQHHDWITIQRGRCVVCGKTFTFLPLFSLPYPHYSLLARCCALRHRFVEHCSWEKATPLLKDANRVPDPSTLRRWSSGLAPSQLAQSFLSQVLARIAYWLGGGDRRDPEACFVTCLTPVLHILRPLRV
jgi:hypothetical protein